jgi:hypothetical protein
VGLAVLVGVALPMHWGWVPAFGVLALALVVGGARLLRRGREPWSALLAARPPLVRVAVLGATAFAGLVGATVCAQGVAAIAVAQPAAIGAIVLVVVAAIVVPWTRGAAPFVALAVVIAVPILAFVGARFEARGAEARGWMQSGPIHGIHPFQTTAVIIDGYGPFDLPINDYVEPIGGRGYDPIALAAAIEHSLHAIAEVHFAHGPERARKAFAGASAGAVSTAPVQERLDREPTETEHWRFWVQSGTTGQRSRVEFVCPGRRDGPRPAPPESPMHRMCPDKYANEASAGLGVTGRWPGYAEFRGNERVGLSRVFGWTRSDDAIGRGLVRNEVLFGAWTLLAIAVALAWRARGRRAGTTWLAVPLVGVLAVVVVLAGAGQSDVAHIPAFARAPAWIAAWHLPLWLGALAWPAASGLAAWIEPRGDGRRETARSLGWIVGALAIAITAVIVATDLDVHAWAVPDRSYDGGALPLADLVAGVADRWHASSPEWLDILEREAIVGALVGSVLALACIAFVGVVGTAARAVLGAERTGGVLASQLVLVATTVLAGALAVSRKTDGGSALIPAAMAAAWVLGCTLDEIRRRGPAAAAGPSVARAAVLVAWIALGVLLVLQSGALSGPWDFWRTLYGVCGLVATALPLAVLLPDRRGGAGTEAANGPGSAPGEPA